MRCKLLYRLPEELVFEVARHPLDQPDALASLPYTNDIMKSLRVHAVKLQQEDRNDGMAINHATSGKIHTKSVPVTPPVLVRSTSAKMDKTVKASTQGIHLHTNDRPPWK